MFYLVSIIQIAQLTNYYLKNSHPKYFKLNCKDSTTLELAKGRFGGSCLLLIVTLVPCNF